MQCKAKEDNLTDATNELSLVFMKLRKPSASGHVTEVGHDEIYFGAPTPWRRRYEGTDYQ